MIDGDDTPFFIMDIAVRVDSIVKARKIVHNSSASIGQQRVGNLVGDLIEGVLVVAWTTPGDQLLSMLPAAYYPDCRLFVHFLRATENEKLTCYPFFCVTDSS